MLLLCSSVTHAEDRVDRIRSYTRGIEFDYVSWMLDNLGLKLRTYATKPAAYLKPGLYPQIVSEYRELVVRIYQVESSLNQVYSDPNIPNPEEASEALREQLRTLREREAELEPVVEALIEQQMSEVLASLGLTSAGQTVPPVLFHSTSLPLALIISPREVIRQEADISLLPEIPLDEQVNLEKLIESSADVSSLVVPIGGVGVYPSMISQTSDLVWLAETVAHEWVHNYFTLRPLGASYYASPELRIMNETAASIAGKEIGRLFIARYYPELLPEEHPAASAAPVRNDPTPSDAPVFDFTAEMRQTRITVDKLLAEGKIEEAEEYMENRRVIFWDHGYRHIRRLNQAYFAFYGAYADSTGGGADGGDPVGAAVRELRAQSASITEFIKRIAWLDSFEALQNEISAAQYGY